MTCFLVDDQLLRNGKILDALERAGGPHVIALWLAVGTSCGAANTEGVVAPAVASSDARTLMISPELAAGAIDALIAARLWHDSRTVRKCDACLEHLSSHGLGTLPKGSFLFHDWGQQQFSRQVAKDPVARDKHNRKKQLHRDPDLIRAIRRRDGERCRFCAENVDFEARKGARRGTYDHVDPDGPNELWNVVVSCGRCNGIKKDRTPEEAGMTLLPAPDRRPIALADEVTA